MRTRPPTPPWMLVSLRPRGQHQGLRQAAAREGGRLLALSTLAIAYRDDPATRRARRQAQSADLWLFTSPNAVRAAHALEPLRLRRGQAALAVGAGTRRALARLGIAAAAPARMDSEGLLAMPQLTGIGGRRIALFTAPGGRDRLAPALRARGATVARIDAYARVPLQMRTARWRALAAALQARAPLVLAVSSGEALQALLSQLPGALRPGMLRLPAVAASERLALLARQAGFQRVAVAPDARPASLARTAARTFV